MRPTKRTTRTHLSSEYLNPPRKGFPQLLRKCRRLVDLLDVLNYLVGGKRPNHKCLLWVISLLISTWRSCAEKNGVWISLFPGVANIIWYFPSREVYCIFHMRCTLVVFNDNPCYKVTRRMSIMNLSALSTPNVNVVCVGSITLLVKQQAFGIDGAVSITDTLLSDTLPLNTPRKCNAALLTLIPSKRLLWLMTH